MQQLVCVNCGEVIAAIEGDVRPHSWSDTARCRPCRLLRDAELREAG